jgi:hypothetical protein
MRKLTLILVSLAFTGCFSSVPEVPTGDELLSLREAAKSARTSAEALIGEARSVGDAASKAAEEGLCPTALASARTANAAATGASALSLLALKACELLPELEECAGIGDVADRALEVSGSIAIAADSIGLVCAQKAK